MTERNGQDDDLPVVRRANPRWLKRSAAVVTLASAAAIVFAFARGIDLPSDSGALSATERQTIALGSRAVAVVEPGTDLHWTVTGGRSVRVEQTDGVVFYRVDRGGPFVVRTPGGEISVLGTCLTVDVRPVNPSRQTRPGGAAARSAIVLLTVHEGRVLFANDAGTTEVGAGERVRAWHDGQGGFGMRMDPGGRADDGSSDE